MISDKIKIKLIDISFSLINIPNSEKKHFSFIVNRNKILSIGWNDSKVTHPIAKRYGYWEGVRHSELDAILKFLPHYKNLKDCSLINVRVNSKGFIKQSKPCSICSKLIVNYGIGNVYHTNELGNFEQYM